MKNISLQIFWKLLCLHITHSWFHLFLLQCFQSQHTQTGTFSLFPRWLSYHSLVATTVRFHISQLINVRFYWWTKLFIDWRTPKFSKLIYFPNWSYIQNQKYLFGILFSIHLLLVLKNDEDVAWWALYCHVFLKLLTVFRSVVNCCEVLNEHYLFWFHLLRHVVLESNFYRISSCLQSRRFPEDPRVGHQSAGRQNHQCLLSWGVSCPCYLSAVFGNLVCFFLRSVWVTSTTNLNEAVRFFRCGRLTAKRLSLFCQFCVWKKSTGFFLPGCLVVQSVWKLKTRCFQMYH